MGMLLERLNDVTLSEVSDERFMPFGRVSCAGNQEIWSFGPKKCKMFHVCMAGSLQSTPHEGKTSLEGSHHRGRVPIWVSNG
jgi:hypothetical protein